MFGFEEWALKPEDLDISKTEFLIDDFLVKESITLVYGAPSQGKTWFMYALSKYLAANALCKKLFYIDMDNGKRQLSDREVAEKLLVLPSLTYISKSKIPKTAVELLYDINKEAYGENYKDIVFVFDSTRDFVDNTKNDVQAKRFMEIMKNIREAGGTVLLIHHATKSGKVIDGSGEFAKSADNVYELKQRLKTGTSLHYFLKVENDRDPIKNAYFSVDTKTYELTRGDEAFGDMTKDEEAFVRKVLDLLLNSPGGLNQSKILAALGKSRDDKKGRGLIEKFRGRFWEVEYVGKQKIYKAM
ncbi:AAA family ATPase [Hydrogenimonas thermophila]|uniref:AAA family ATPase n=1 Tax=Hydrogenimonas thermophila TaxID=223786 RepID=UPI002936DF2E|nr:AAA family ATPase [Hydrogenimonas thermophila]WOE69114.1 AAA family ATPase [Hydrogenimonas thermophila]WOE71624.1 AAA family ATPase [Hydrogenimonas thermophila]